MAESFSQQNTHQIKSINKMETIVTSVWQKASYLSNAC
jgi:hypothetical protein